MTAKSMAAVIGSVPVVDASRLSDPEVLQQIDQACREWGFFQVVQHGIDTESSQTLRREMRAFFGQPLAAKRSVERSAKNPWGFYDRELTKNTRDSKEIFDCGPAFYEETPTPWPFHPPGFRQAARDFMHSCEQLAFRLLGAIATNLGTPPESLGELFRPTHTSFLRLNYYPVSPVSPVAEPPSDARLGIHPHTDAGALTLLLQDEEPGLEVFRGERWHLVEPRGDAIVVNIGDIVQVWSNDRYLAALHRVRASAERARYSAPYFFNPAYDCCYAPLSTTVDAGTPAHYSPISWAEFRSLRAAGDYQNFGEEVQIGDYRIDDAL